MFQFLIPAAGIFSCYSLYKELKENPHKTKLLKEIPKPKLTIIIDTNFLMLPFYRVENKGYQISNSMLAQAFLFFIGNDSVTDTFDENSLFGTGSVSNKILEKINKSRAFSFIYKLPVNFIFSEIQKFCLFYHFFNVELVVLDCVEEELNKKYNEEETKRHAARGKKLLSKIKINENYMKYNEPEIDDKKFFEKYNGPDSITDKKLISLGINLSDENKRNIIFIPTKDTGMMNEISSQLINKKNIYTFTSFDKLTNKMSDLSSEVLEEFMKQWKNKEV